jgi:hypothetical protein
LTPSTSAIDFTVSNFGDLILPVQILWRVGWVMPARCRDLVEVEAAGLGQLLNSLT